MSTTIDPIAIAAAATLQANATLAGLAVQLPVLDKDIALKLEAPQFGVDANMITKGVFPPERLGTGAPNDMTYLNGDGAWVPAPMVGLPNTINGGTF